MRCSGLTARMAWIFWISLRSGMRRSTHIPQIRAAVPSITAVSRYQLVDPESPGRSDRYLAVYELDTGDIPAAAAALADSAAAGRMDMTTAMNVTDNPPAAQWFQEVAGLARRVQARRRTDR
jgi:hypothetical protein